MRMKYLSFMFSVLRFMFDNPLENAKSLWENGIEIRITIKSDTIQDDLHKTNTTLVLVYIEKIWYNRKYEIYE